MVQPEWGHAGSPGAPVQQNGLHYVAQEHAVGRGWRRGGDTGDLRAGWLRPGTPALPRCRVADHRHLPDVPHTDDAAVPATGEGDRVPGAVRQAPIADPGVS